MEQTLITWANSFLAQRDLKIESFPKDLSDGLLLSALYEIISKNPLNVKLDAKPKIELQKTNNVGVVLKKFSEQGVKHMCSPESVTKGDVKSILGLLWCVVCRFNSFDDLLKKAKEELADVIPKEAFDQKKLSVLLGDGIFLLELLKKRIPNVAIDIEKAKQESNTLKNLQLGFEIAEKELKIPRLFQAEEFVQGKVEENAIFVYLSYFFPSKEQHTLVRKESVQNAVSSEEYEALKKKVAELAENLQKKEHEYSTIVVQKEKTIEELKKNVSDLTSELTNLSLSSIQESSEFETMSEVDSSQMQNLMEEMEKSNQMMKQLEEEKLKLEKELQMAKEQLLKEQNRLLELTLEKTKLHEEIEELKKQNDDQLFSQISALEMQLKERNEEEEKLNKNKAAFSQRELELQKKLEEANKEKERLEKENAKRMAELSNLKKNRAGGGKKLKKKLEEEMALKAKLEEENKLLKKHAKQTQKQVNNWEKEKESWQKKLETLEKEKEQSTTHQELENNLKSVQKQLKEKEEEIERLRARRNHYKRQSMKSLKGTNSSQSLQGTESKEDKEEDSDEEKKRHSKKK